MTTDISAEDCRNQMLGLHAALGTQPVDGRPAHLRDLLAHDGEGAPIRVADHCCGCTAGQGSSCGGALDAAAPAATAQRVPQLA